MGALRVACAEESSVDGEDEPRPALEKERRQQDAEPQQDLEASDDGHRRVVVFLNECTNSVGQGAVDLGAGRVCVGSRRRRRDDGDQVGASVRGDVEDGVDSVGEQGQRVLRSQKPDESHDCKN